MNLMDYIVYTVLYRVRSSGSLWLKASQNKATAILPRPNVGDRPVICNTLLSTALSVMDSPQGYEIVTENSTYRVALLTGRELLNLRLEQGFRFSHVSESGSMYYKT